MPMFPPELESTKYEGAAVPLPKTWRQSLPHRHAFMHAVIAFALANCVYAYLSGGLVWHYALAVFVGFAFALRWWRNLATLPWIYGLATGYACFAFLLGLKYAG